MNICMQSYYHTSAYQYFIPDSLILYAESRNKVHEFQNAVLIGIFPLLIPYLFQGYIGCLLRTSILFVLTIPSPKFATW